MIPGQQPFNTTQGQLPGAKGGDDKAMRMKQMLGGVQGAAPQNTAAQAMRVPMQVLQQGMQRGGTARPPVMPTGGARGPMQPNMMGKPSMQAPAQTLRGNKSGA
jgi:hypothetical protein